MDSRPVDCLYDACHGRGERLSKGVCSPENIGQTVRNENADTRPRRCQSDSKQVHLRWCPHILNICHFCFSLYMSNMATIHAAVMPATLHSGILQAGVNTHQ